MKKIYYRVYQDKENMCGRSFVKTMSDVSDMINYWVETSDNLGLLMPVFEPVLMTEDEFNSLPKFEGY